MSKATSAALGEMLNKRMTPDQYIETCQAAADQVKNDPEVTKFTREE
jgi:hypothetical protein